MRQGLAIGGAALVVLGAWIAKTHPAGFALAAVPILVWAALHGRAWWIARRQAPRKPL